MAYWASNVDHPGLAIAPFEVTDQVGWTDVVVGTYDDGELGYVVGCALRAGGERWCWGNGPLGNGLDDNYNYNRKAPAPIDAGWARLSAGRGHACGVKLDGRLWCWGFNYQGQVGAGPGVVDSPTEVATGATWIDVACGEGFTCAVRSDRTLACWGDGYGSASGGPAATPMQVGTASDWTRIAAGSRYVCGIKSDGSLWCFGNNDWSQLGLGSVSTPVLSPARVGTRSDWAMVRLGANHACALTADDELYCWGLNVHGELALEVGTSSAVVTSPTAVAGFAWSDIAPSDSHHTCGRTTQGEVYCWGSNVAGQLATDETLPEPKQPKQVGTDTDWADVAPGNWARKIDGSIHKWNVVGTLVNSANGYFGYVHSPSPMQVGIGAVAGTLSDSVVPCFVQADGTALGDDLAWCTSTASYEAKVCPVSPKPHAGTWQRIASNWPGDTQCGIDLAGGLWCWGSNSWGAFGNGTTTDSVTPVTVSGGGTWQRLSMDGQDVCAIKADGTLWCWGAKFGNSPPALTPEQVGTTTDWAEVSVSGGSGCALETDSTLWCWGGKYTTIDPTEPVPVGTATWKKVSAKGHVTCGLQADGSLWCWGGFGQPSVQPAKVDEGWLDVATYGDQLCGIKLGGTLWCWPQQDGDVHSLPVLIAIP